MYIDFYRISGQNFLRIDEHEIEDVKEVTYKSSANGKAELLITIESEMLIFANGVTGLHMREPEDTFQQETHITEGDSL